MDGFSRLVPRRNSLSRQCLQRQSEANFSSGGAPRNPDKLFNNGLEGKQWRTIDIYKDDKIDEGSLKTLINAAVDYNTTKLKTTNKSSGTRGNLKKKPAV